MSRARHRSRTAELDRDALAEPVAMRAWVDESAHLPTAASPGFYLLAACIGSDSRADEVRAILRRLVVGKARRLHWRAETEAHQDQIALAIAHIDDIQNLVVIGCPLDPKRQERARRICMERLVYELKGLGVTDIAVERRQDRQNAKDVQMLNALRASGVLHRSTHVEFVAPEVDPMLWVPDAVAGAVGAIRKGDRPAFELDALAARVEQIEVTVS